MDTNSFLEDNQKQNIHKANDKHTKKNNAKEMQTKLDSIFPWNVYQDKVDVVESLKGIKLLK